MAALRLLKFSGPIGMETMARLRQERARSFRSLAGDMTYAYVADELYDGALSIVSIGLKLTSSLVVEGADRGCVAPFRYIVETDVTPELEADFNAWYAEEHLPGLAAVPGTVRAEQYLVEGAAPRYHSIYDLVSTETFNSPAWLAVRATPWSDRVRPAFRNTIRTMFRAMGSD